MQKVNEYGFRPLGDPKKYTLSDNNAHPLTDVTGLTLTESWGATDTNLARKADKAIVSVEAAAIRYGFGTVTQAIGHKAMMGAVIYLESMDEVSSFRFCNEAAGVNAVIQVQAGVL